MGLKKHVVQITNRGHAGLFYLLTIDCPTGRLHVLFQRLYQISTQIGDLSAFRVSGCGFRVAGFTFLGFSTSSIGFAPKYPFFVIHSKKYVNKKKCIWCGGLLEGKQLRYHPKCRRLAYNERRKKGTGAVNDEKVCAWTGCSKQAKKGGRYCSDACKMKAYRARKGRK